MRFPFKFQKALSSGKYTTSKFFSPPLLSGGFIPCKYYGLNWYEEVFAIQKFKTTVPWAYVISHLKDWRFYEKE